MSRKKPVVPAPTLPETPTYLDLIRRNGTVLRVWFDAGDYPLISRYCWRSKKGKNTFYARADVGKADGRRTTVFMHRLLLPDAPKVDHIDGDGLNNRRSNLRSATNAQNLCNRRKTSATKSSKFKGVFFDKRANKYRAKIEHNGKQPYLGYFATEVEAALAYNAAAKELHGEFARLNDVAKQAVAA